MKIIKNKKITIQKKNKCFTIAETLITLVIIGVVAALTVPNMIIRHQKEETVTRIKKAYSSLSQAINRSITDNGPIETWDFGDHTAEGTINFLNQYFIPYLNIMKEPTSTDGGWNTEYFSLNGNRNVYGNNQVRFYLSDGTSVTTVIWRESDTRIHTVSFRIDINGDKKPNKSGRDLFSVGLYPFDNDNIHKGKLYPPYAVISSRSNLLANSNDMCNKNQTGTACLALIMKDSWKISDDYPW